MKEDFLKQLSNDLLRAKTWEELCILAFSDQLTGVYNRNMLEELRSSFDEREVWVAIVDIDNLKTINDTEGHLTGDTVIKVLAHHLESTYDYVFRLGGDEFLLVHHCNRGICATGVSCGWINKPSWTTLHEAMKTADERLYEAKRSRLKGQIPSQQFHGL
jgi:GGDEF domain-containing protein